MPSKAMLAAFNKVIEADGDVEDAIDAAVRAQIDVVYDGGKSLPRSMEYVARAELLAVFDVEPE